MSEEPPKVVGLDGKAIAEPDDPVLIDGEVVGLLEQLLNLAREGKITGVAVCYIEPDKDGECFKSSWKGPQMTLLGALGRAWYAMNRTLDGQDRGTIGT